jgi:hypothetical protein
VHRPTQTDRGRTGGLFCPGPDPNGPIRTFWLSEMGRPAGDALKMQAASPADKADIRWTMQGTQISSNLISMQA